jgi:hypothetical protein
MIVRTATRCCQPMYQLVMKLAPVSTDMSVGGKPGTGANRHISCYGTMSMNHRLWSIRYITLIIIFGQLPMKF